VVDTTDAVMCDADMSEIGAENERKLAAMSQDEILAKQRELLSTLGSIGVAKFPSYSVFCNIVLPLSEWLNWQCDSYNRN